MEVYEYVGFKYEVKKDDYGAIILSPMPNQHPAAYKSKHLINAMDMYHNEHKEQMK